MTILSNTYGIAARKLYGLSGAAGCQGAGRLRRACRGARLRLALGMGPHSSRVEPHFPILDSLTTLTAIAARTGRIKLGTGILVLPLRNPVALAKQLSSMDQFFRRPADHGNGLGLVQARVRRDGNPVQQARQVDGREPRDSQPALDREDGRRKIHGATKFRPR